MTSKTIGNTTFNYNDGNPQVTVGNQTITLNTSGGSLSYTATISGVTYGVSFDKSGNPTFNIGAVSFASNADGYTISASTPIGGAG